MNNNTHEGAGSPPTRPIYNKEGIFKICLAAISVILAAFTGAFFGIVFDIETMYFENVFGAYILGGAVAIAVTAIIVLSITLKAKAAPAKHKGTTLLQYLGSIALFLLFLQCIIDTNVWLVIFSLIAIAYFIGLFNKHYIANTVLGIGAVLFYGAAIAQTYFDYSIAVNSPYKLLCQFGMALSMLLIVSEIKFELGGRNSVTYNLISTITFILNISATAASVALVISGAQNTNHCFIPCAAMAIYSAKIFFARPGTVTQTNDAQTPTDEKGTDTDENVN